MYREKVISEAEYLKKMHSILEDYRTGRTTVSYPEAIRNNVHAQAFFGVLTAIFDEAQREDISSDLAAEISIRITEIIAAHSQVDWSDNKTIHDRISQNIDDMFYDYEVKQGLEIPFEIVDKVIENVKTVALRRF